jgi:uncharacterized protein HemX
LQYVLSSLVWSLGGGFIGFLIGRMTAKLERVDQEVHEVHEYLEGHVADNEQPTRDEPPMEVAIVAEPDSKNRWWLGVVLLVLALGTSISTYIAVQEAQDTQQALTEALERERALRQCVERRFTEFADNLDARADSTQRRFDEFDRVLLAAATATDSSTVVAALDRYQRQRRLINRELERNPIERPTTTCREENPVP